MGSGSFDIRAYAQTAKAAAYDSQGRKKHYTETFKQRSVAPELDVRTMKLKLNESRKFLRECRCSSDHPNPTPIILALDVTGSMGKISQYMVEEGLGIVMKTMLDSCDVPDPQLMFMAVGDLIANDSAPLQVSQFESDNRIVTQLMTIWQEGGGGGNFSESYTLPWLFADAFVDSDSYEKSRGFLFTIGDELVPPDLTYGDVARLFANSEVKTYLKEYFAQFTEGPVTSSSRIPTSVLFERVSKHWEVIHIIIEEGSFARDRISQVYNSWERLIGRRAVSLSDYTALPEVITTSIRLASGLEDPNLLAETASPVIKKAFKL